MAGFLARGSRNSMQDMEGSKSFTKLRTSIRRHTSSIRGRTGAQTPTDGRTRSPSLVGPGSTTNSIDTLNTDEGKTALKSDEEPLKKDESLQKFSVLTKIKEFWRDRNDPKGPPRSIQAIIVPGGVVVGGVVSGRASRSPLSNEEGYEPGTQTVDQRLGLQTDTDAAKGLLGTDSKHLTVTQQGFSSDISSELVLYPGGHTGTYANGIKKPRSLLYPGDGSSFNHALVKERADSIDDSLPDSDSIFSHGSSESSDSSTPSPQHKSSAAWQQAEDAIANALASSTTVSEITSRALKKTTPHTVDRRMFRAVKEFSEDVERLGTEKLHTDCSAVLRKSAATIAVKVRELVTSYSISIPEQNTVQKVLGDRHHTDKSEDSDSSGSIEYGESEEYDETKPMGLIEGAKAIERVTRYLKSDTLLDLFLLAVKRNFLRSGQKMLVIIDPSPPKIEIEEKPTKEKEFDERMDESDSDYSGRIIKGYSSEVDRSLAPPNITVDAGTYSSWAEIFANGKMDIGFESTETWTLPNHLKGLVEDFIDAPINWWPLSPRRTPLPHGCTQVNWKCRCGKKLSGVISKSRMREYNRWLYHNAPSPMPPHSSDGTSVVRYAPSKTNGVASSIMSGTHSLKSLIWCVNTKLHTALTSIDITSADTDSTVFQKLKQEYRITRGWSEFFSLYEISEICFVRFRSHGDGYVGCHTKEELPKYDDPNYQYEPRDRKVEEAPPLPVEELMEYFTNPSCAGTSPNILRCLPKKLDGKIQAGDGHGWGLHAREQLSLFRICILSLLILVMTFTFIPMWSRRQPGGPESAFVPPFYFLAFALLEMAIARLVFPTVSKAMY